MNNRGSSPYQRGYEAGARAAAADAAREQEWWRAGWVEGWAARDEVIADRWADVVIVLRPDTIGRALDRKAIRLAEMEAHAAATGRPEWPGNDALNILRLHRHQKHGGKLASCLREPCAELPLPARRAADKWRER